MDLRKLLKKVLTMIPFFLIIFSLAIKTTSAASFKYEDFDFDEFIEQNANYWTTSCQGTDEEVEKCKDEIIESQRKFYTKLYKLLTKKKKKGYIIDDAIIIATVFFEYDPNAFSDTSGAYNIDENNDDDGDDQTAAYYEAETDTLKLLINAMIGYERVCYGVSDPILVESETGGTDADFDDENTDSVDDTEENEDSTANDETESTLEYACPSGSLDEENNQCLTKISSTSTGFWDKFSSNASTFFGIKTKTYDNCNEKAISEGYYSGVSKVSASQSVVEDGYWDFLENGTYFDNKPLLDHYFAKVYTKAGFSSMAEFNESSVKDDYADELVEVRKEITANIKDLVDIYRLDKSNVNFTDSGSNSYWWPVGSSETTDAGGITYASGDPVSTAISSNYGMRTNPVSGIYKLHAGVDLSGGTSTAGVVNVIAAKSGTVTYVSTGCLSFGDTSCGGGYGNYVMITHSDGAVTLYAHMHQNSITVKVGDTVSQGQVIGKMGSSGNSTGTHLHFEIRPDGSNTVDPLDGYIDPDNPRPTSSSSDLVNMLIGLEGAPMSGSDYLVYCNSNDVPTVGPGITLTYNASVFAEYGYPLTTSNSYYNYCGTTMSTEIVDQVFAAVLNNFQTDVKATLASNGLSLASYQIDALTSLKYNCGNINGFVSAYKTYGATQALCNNWWINKASSGTYGAVLKKRRTKECNLFLTGIYDGSYS
jgi:murein DD-endopeptidase MepM/ murein hydrolase activator NlpD/GH24 family phage-related lysozyme (muramidase)